MSLGYFLEVELRGFAKGLGVAIEEKKRSLKCDSRLMA